MYGVELTVISRDNSTFIHIQLVDGNPDTIIENLAALRDVRPLGLGGLSRFGSSRTSIQSCESLLWLARAGSYISASHLTRLATLLTFT